MRLKEFEGKALFKKSGIPIPKSVLVKKKAGLKQIKKEVVVKAQVLVGGRGKAGAIRKANPSNYNKIVSSLLGSTVKGYKVEEVLMEDAILIDKEFYVGFTLDRISKSVVCMVSEEGGIDIEQVAKKMPEKIITFPISTFNKKEIGKKLKVKEKQKIIPILSRLYWLMKQYDASLVEINPLVLSQGRMIALDSKIVLDDNALYRHPEFRKEKGKELTKIESKAFDAQLQYVELDGNVAVIGDGAGLVMATLDVLNYYGLKPANFLDVGGGASVKKMEKAVELALLKKGVKAFFINIFGGITRCDEIAQGLVNYKKRKKIRIPLVVRMTGTNEEAAQRILKQNDIYALDTMEECAQKIKQLIKR